MRLLGFLSISFCAVSFLKVLSKQLPIMLILHFLHANYFALQLEQHIPCPFICTLGFIKANGRVFLQHPAGNHTHKHGPLPAEFLRSG